MLNKSESLLDLSRGKTAVVETLECEPEMKRRLMELGFVKGSTVECIGGSSGGNPRCFYIRGTVIALRCADCACVKTKREAEHEE